MGPGGNGGKGAVRNLRSHSGLVLPVNKSRGNCLNLESDARWGVTEDTSVRSEVSRSAGGPRLATSTGTSVDTMSRWGRAEPSMLGPTHLRLD